MNSRCSPSGVLGNDSKDPVAQHFRDLLSPNRVAHAGVVNNNSLQRENFRYTPSSLSFAKALFSFEINLIE